MLHVTPHQTGFARWLQHSPTQDAQSQCTGLGHGGTAYSTCLGPNSCATCKAHGCLPASLAHTPHAASRARGSAWGQSSNPHAETYSSICHSQTIGHVFDAPSLDSKFFGTQTGFQYCQPPNPNHPFWSNRTESPPSYTSRALLQAMGVQKITAAAAEPKANLLCQV